jgi:hypothetical protein
MMSSLRRTILGLTLLGSQAFLYKAIFFTYGLILTNFYGIDDASVGTTSSPSPLGTCSGRGSLVASSTRWAGYR